MTGDKGGSLVKMVVNLCVSSSVVVKGGLGWLDNGINPSSSQLYYFIPMSVVFEFGVIRRSPHFASLYS